MSEAHYSPSTRGGLFLVNDGSPPPDVHLRSSSSDAPIWRNPDTANANDQTMTTPTREEIDAKLETIEVRMDGRVASIEANIAGFMARIDDRANHTDARFDRMESTIKETLASVSGLKTTMILTALSTVLAIVFGVAAFNATVLSNMVASFESGKNTSAAQADVKRQSEETAALLRELKAQMPQNPAKK